MKFCQSSIRSLSGDGHDPKGAPAVVSGSGSIIPCVRRQGTLVSFLASELTAAGSTLVEAVLKSALRLSGLGTRL